jgi:hypothetical protein
MTDNNNPEILDNSSFEQQPYRDIHNDVELSGLDRLGPLPECGPVDLLGNPELGERGREWRKQGDIIEQYILTKSPRIGQIAAGHKRRARF